MRLLGLLLLSLCLSGAAAQSAPQAGAQAVGPGSRFEGLASWYGGVFHGRQTASGEIFDKEGLSAAHRSLPFGTLLRVTSLDTGASVVVRVNDRGPFVGERILDLSEGAARLIGLVATGTARVSCLVLPPEEAASFGSPGPRLAAAPPAPGAPGPAAPGAAESCRIQVASYRDAANAAATRERLLMAGLSAELEAAGAYTRVVFPSVPAAEAEALQARLRSLGYRELLVTWIRPAGR